MKKFLLLAVIAFIALFTVACGTSEEENKTSGSDEGSKKEESSEQPETITVKHELGETEVPKNPEKVVVFDFGMLDTMNKLGIEVTALPKKIIPKYLSEYNDEKYENVGSLKEPDFEKIAEIDPDLIIISGRQSDVYEQLKELAPTVYLGLDATRYMDSFKENVTTVGEIFGKEEEVKTELEDIEGLISSVNEKAEKLDKKALLLLANDDKISAYGPNSRFGLIHDVLGLPAADENIEASTHGMNVSFEYVVEQNPELLYVIDRSAAIGAEGSSAKQMVENELVENTTAYKNDDIYYLDPELWYLSGGGLISVKEMIKEVEASLEK
ncbi:ABC transporter substrate-binding protein [Virgibacillus halodenitrificans]|nr:ABC transporter substrate-binding protein [Virgibacillus halodenitrificans]